MIRKLQRKFILIATVAVIVLLVAALGTVNLINYYRANQEVNEVLDIIIDNDGSLPDFTDLESARGFYDAEPEMAFQTRYFSVTLDSSGDVITVNIEHIAAISDEEARKYALQVISSSRTMGYFNDGSNAIYAYKYAETSDGEILAVVLDCTRYMKSAQTFAYYSLRLGIICTVLYVILLTLLSRRLLRPIIRNMQNQKQFITNAGHELKTPIAVISANTEVLEMLNGKNEWTESTMNQVKRLSGLVNELISLAKLGEQVDVPLGPVSFSKEAEASAEEFRVIAEQQQKTLVTDIEQGIIVKAQSSGLRELVNILTDNAVKYCDDGGTIGIRLEKIQRGKNVRLTVSNDYKDGASVDYSRFFERFYRQDESHSRGKKSGYGIGLSMAEGFVRMFSGKIDVSWKDGVIHFTVVLPVLRTESPEETENEKGQQQ